MEPTKYCPLCGSEYLPAAQACADCGGPLEWRRERDELPPLSPDDRWSVMPPGMAGLLVEDDQASVQDYVELLIEHRIPSAVLPVVRIGPDGAPQLVWDGRAVGYRHYLFVPREDYTEAETLVQEARRRRDPGLAENPYVDFPEEGCPACGSPLPDAADECPDCGLPFASE